MGPASCHHHDMIRSLSFQTTRPVGGGGGEGCSLITHKQYYFRDQHVFEQLLPTVKAHQKDVPRWDGWVEQKNERHRTMMSGQRTGLELVLLMGYPPHQSSLDTGCVIYHTKPRVPWTFFPQRHRRYLDVRQSGTFVSPKKRRIVSRKPW